MKHTLDPQYFESPTRIDNTALNMQHENRQISTKHKVYFIHQLPVLEQRTGNISDPFPIFVAGPFPW